MDRVPNDVLASILRYAKSDSLESIFEKYGYKYKDIGENKQYEVPLSDVARYPDELFASIRYYYHYKMYILLVCKKFYETALSYVFQPWADICDERAVGLYHALTHGHAEYYLKWSKVAGSRWNSSIHDNSPIAVVCGISTPTPWIGQNPMGRCLLTKTLLEDPDVELSLDCLFAAVDDTMLDNRYLELVKLIVDDPKFDYPDNDENGEALWNKIVTSEDSPEMGNIMKLLYSPTSYLCIDVDSIMEHVIISAQYHKLGALLTCPVFDEYLRGDSINISGNSEDRPFICLPIDWYYPKTPKDYHNMCETAKLLINDNRFDPTDDYHRLLRETASFGHTEILRMILNDPRVNPNDSRCINYLSPSLDESALYYALSEKHTETAIILLEDPRIILPEKGSAEYDMIVEQKLEDYIRPRKKHKSE